ncbi:MAG: GNAT family N-acetyltransferase [Nitrososphaerales archaeon]|jgi:GNAT superfamily N-acetyltransferase
MNGSIKGMTIRRASLNDLDTLVDQRHRMFEDIQHRSSKMHKVADAAYRKWVIEMTKKRRFVGFLAVKEDGEPVAGGCVWLRESQPSPGSIGSLMRPYLLSMYTKPKFRGRGIATLIVKEGMRWSKRRGYTSITLHASKFGRSVYSNVGWKRTWEMRADLTKFPMNHVARGRRN